MEFQPQNVREMFDRIAPAYDVMNRVLSAGIDRSWRARAVRDLPPGPVLDLCAGTLDLAALVRRTHARVVAVDFSKEMLARGAMKAHGIETVVGDAMNLPMADASFAAVVCGFGMRNLWMQSHAPERALREVHRVLAPGGVFVTLEFFRPISRRARAFHAAFGRVAPFVGNAVARDRAAYDYLAQSIRGFIRRDEYESALRREAFVSVRGEDLTQGIVSIVRGQKK